MINIITDEELLKVESEEVVEDDVELVKSTVEQLKEYLKENENVNSICASQIGIKKKIFCLRDGEEIITYINPGVKLTEDFVIESEQYVPVCEHNASYQGKQFMNFRANKILVRYSDESLRLVESELKEEFAFMFQQMLDMINGVVPTVTGLELPEGYDDLSDEEKQQCVEIYMQYVENLRDMLDKEIDEDKDLSQRRDALKFKSALLRGEVEIEKDEKEILEKYKSKKSKLYRGNNRGRGRR